MRLYLVRTGILNRAGEASDNSKRQSIVEQLQLRIMEKQVTNDGTITGKEVKEVLTASGYFETSAIAALGIADNATVDSMKSLSMGTSDGKYTITLAEVLGSVTTSGGNGGGSSSSARANITPALTEGATTYSAGDEVTFGEEQFYVVSDDGTTVLLLAKYCVKSDGSEQYDKDATYSTYGRSFSSTNYWSSDFTSTPFDLQTETMLGKIPSGDTTANNAIKCAQAYGTEKGVTGRLMTYAEADAMKTSNSAIMYGKWTDGTQPTDGFLFWWLGAASNTDIVLAVGGSYSSLGNYSLDITYNGVRPVLEIS